MVTKYTVEETPVVLMCTRNIASIHVQLSKAKVAKESVMNNIRSHMTQIAFLSILQCVAHKNAMK